MPSPPFCRPVDQEGLPGMADATFSSLYDLMITELHRRDPMLLPAAARGRNAEDLTAGKKRSALLHAFETGGAATILSIGDGVRRTGFDPVLFILRRSATPEILAGKWERLEGYGHSRHRTELKFKDNQLFCRRHSLKGPAPHPAENLLMCGILLTLFREIGCQDLVCELLPARRAPVTVFHTGRFDVPEEMSGGFRRWRLSWSSFKRADVINPLNPNSPPVLPDLPGGAEMLRKAAALLESDVGHCWSVKELAGALNQSTRSLQRRFQETGHTFSALVRAVRVREACRLLAGTDLSATEIGFWCGFTDSAHFSREFRRMTSMPPSVYRAATQAGAGLTRPG